jgi:hypothetical protein
MRRQVHGFMIAAALLACAGGARAAEGRTVVVTLQAINGAPADSASRLVFMGAFEQEFEAEELPWEIRNGETWRSAGQRPNQFHLVDLAAPEDAWTLEVTLGLPPSVVVARPKQKSSDPTQRPRTTDFRASRGLTIVAAVTPPVTSVGPEPGEPVKFAVYFPDARRVVVPSYKLPGGAYAYPWEEAGRCAARAALEVLHRASASLDDDERANLAPALRMEAPE